MIEDSVVAEVRKAREEIAKKFDYDLKAIIEDREKAPSAQRTKGRVVSSEAGGTTDFAKVIRGGLNPQDKEGVMEIVTSWMEEGLEQGERKLLLRLIRKKFGGIDLATLTQLEALPKERMEQLGEALLDFTSVSDLDSWLQSDR